MLLSKKESKKLEREKQKQSRPTRDELAMNLPEVMLSWSSEFVSCHDQSKGRHFHH